MSGIQDSNALWDRFEAMLRVHASALLESFYPPATLEQLEQAERALDVQLPDEVRAAYLRHDGCSKKWIGSLCHLGSLERVVEVWKSCCGVAEELRLTGDLMLGYQPDDSAWPTLKVWPGWFHPKWIPIGVSNTPSCVHVDLCPNPAGKHGQLLQDEGMGEPSVLADSLNGYLEFLIEKVEHGVLKYDNGWVLAASGERVYDWSWVE
jgi:cell wall assembly regulator SMI1